MAPLWSGGTLMRLANCNPIGLGSPFEKRLVMCEPSEEKDHLDYNDLNQEEVEQYVDDYFWGDDDIEDWE